VIPPVFGTAVAPRHVRALGQLEKLGAPKNRLGGRLSSLRIYERHAKDSREYVKLSMIIGDGKGYFSDFILLRKPALKFSRKVAMPDFHFPRRKIDRSAMFFRARGITQGSTKYAVCTARGGTMKLSPVAAAPAILGQRGSRERLAETEISSNSPGAFQALNAQIQLLRPPAAVSGNEDRP
jgi:hypothetical protein